MATVEVAFVSPVGTGPLDAAYPSAKQVFTSSATNQASTITAQAREAAVIVASGGNVYVSFGSAPNAGTDTLRRLVLDGERAVFGQLKVGDKAAIIDA